MPKSSTPSFVCELPLVVSRKQSAQMVARFDAGARVFNAVLGDGLNALALMRESKMWAAAKALPKSKDPKAAKARREAFKACNLHFGFSEYALSALATAHKNAGGFADRLGAHETQKIAKRVFDALQQYAFGKRGKPRFKGAKRKLHSIEGKNNQAGPRWHCDTKTASWGKGFVLPAKMPSKARDPYLHACLDRETKYCRIAWRMEGGKRRWFMQLVQEGLAPAKYEFLASGQVVGIDIGPSTIGIVGDSDVGFERFAPSVEQPWKEIRVLQRAQDRSRRVMNPGNFNPNGTVIKGSKNWVKSSRYKTRQSKLADVERRLAAARKRDHGELVNKILGLGTIVQAEKLSYKSFQKNFGRSVKVRAPSAFVSLLNRKAESAGGKVIELNTWTLKMSQYDHITEACTKKPLKQRWHKLGGTNTLVQRDCYSAFLAKNVIDNQHNRSLLEEAWTAADPLLRRVRLCVEQVERRGRLRLPVVEMQSLPLDRLARQRVQLHGQAQDVVAALKRDGESL